ncbi:MAG: 4'-phosphopantetheinyl transferase EntD [Planctomycetota bacterium]|jgi:4'-phosphopantetheinyl transferase EntD
MPERPLLTGLFGEGVLTRLAPISEQVEDLHPEEWRAVAHTVPARQREFATGRRLAHELIREIGVPDVPLVPREDRVPCWPDGIVGSISHSADHCAVAVARSDSWKSLAVDVEPHLPLEPELWDLICTPAERSWLSRAPDRWRGSLARVIFSAKESVYKAIYPMLRRMLEFHDVQLELQVSFAEREGRFTAALPHGASVPGALQWSEDLIVTSCWVEGVG